MAEKDLSIRLIYWFQRNPYIFLLFVVTFTVCLLLLFRFRALDRERVVTEGEVVIVEYVGQDVYGEGVYEYYWNDVKHIEIEMELKNQVVGSKYKGKYLEDSNFDRLIILYENPVFLVNEKTDKADGVVIDVKDDYVVFEYNVNDEIYTAYQKMDQGFEKSLNSAQIINSVFEVEYWREDFQRAIIYLEL